MQETGAAQQPTSPCFSFGPRASRNAGASSQQAATVPHSASSWLSLTAQANMAHDAPSPSSSMQQAPTGQQSVSASPGPFSYARADMEVEEPLFDDLLSHRDPAAQESPFSIPHLHSSTYAPQPLAYASSRVCAPQSHGVYRPVVAPSTVIFPQYRGIQNSTTVLDSFHDPGHARAMDEHAQAVIARLSAENHALKCKVKELEGDQAEKAALKTENRKLNRMVDDLEALRDELLVQTYSSSEGGSSEEEEIKQEHEVTTAVSAGEFEFDAIADDISSSSSITEDGTADRSTEDAVSALEENLTNAVGENSTTATGKITVPG